MNNIKIFFLAVTFLASTLVACADHTRKEHTVASPDNLTTHEEITPTASEEEAEKEIEPEVQEKVEKMAVPQPKVAKPAEFVKKSSETVPAKEVLPEQLLKEEAGTENIAVEVAAEEKEDTVMEAPAEAEEPLGATAFSHDQWNSLLSRFVTASGKVNYKGFKQDQAKLNAYLEDLSANTPASSWSRNEKLAYWINVYNAYTVKLIVDNYPLKSIQDLGKPWDKKFIKIGGDIYSLNEVEHEIIRKRFNDARIHFAVNCASFSCPKLLNEAYTGAKLEQQLNTQTRAYINNPVHNEISANKGAISQLFNWYADDFVKSAGSVIAFINKYSTVKLRNEARLEYKEYGWSLNE